MAVFMLQTNYSSRRTKICCPSLSSSSIKTGNKRIELCVIIFFVWLFIVFDELNVQTDNLSFARFYTGKSDR